MSQAEGRGPHSGDPDLFATIALRTACDALFTDALSVYATRPEQMIFDCILRVIRQCREQVVVDCVSRPLEDPEGTHHHCPPGWLYDEERQRCVPDEGDPPTCPRGMVWSEEKQRCIVPK